MNMGRLWVTAACVAAWCGCTSAAIPKQKLASTEAAIAHARENEAQNHAAAAEHLRLATSQWNEAKQKIRDGENTQADWLLLRAQADAELAGSMAKEQKRRAEAAKASERLRTLSSQPTPSAPGATSTAPAGGAS